MVPNKDPEGTVVSTGEMPNGQHDSSAGPLETKGLGLLRLYPKLDYHALRYGRSGVVHLVGALVGALPVLGCTSLDEQRNDPNDIVIGAVLPFTGEDSTIGQNLEQALLLAVEDVNRWGGAAGHALRLESRDSNSGSGRGLHALLELLYVDEVRYLVGPEENELANEIVRDIKDLDVVNVLAGYASPAIERVGREGAWLRLPPSPFALGCGLSTLAAYTGVDMANSVVAQDDFNQSVASEFSAHFRALGGRILPSTTVRAGAQSYTSRVAPALSSGADRTLLIVNPTTAATIVTEWAVGVRSGSWLFGPMLQTPGLLDNVPPGVLDGTRVLSPTLSLASECEDQAEQYRGPVECGDTNAQAFRKYFASRWDGDLPFPAAHFYYDAVILLAMGLEYAAQQGQSPPTAREFHGAVLEMTTQADERGRWDQLEASMDSIRQGHPLAYTGAAAEYQFDRYGAARHVVFDSWRIWKRDYTDEGALWADCPKTED